MSTDVDSPQHQPTVSGNPDVLRTWKAGEAELNGYLEDHSYLVEGLLELYQTTFEPRWFIAAKELAETTRR
jgi:uncharacterized protein YyaL (SSP411 family)